jgi:cbb3-type cytochrome oxidase subunit 3
VEIHPTSAAGIARTFIEGLNPDMLPMGVAILLLGGAFIWYTKARNAFDAAARAALAETIDDLQATNKDLHERLEAVKAERDRAHEKRETWQGRYYDELERRLGHPVARPEEDHEDPA